MRQSGGLVTLIILHEQMIVTETHQHALNQAFHPIPERDYSFEWLGLMIPWSNYRSQRQ